MTVIQVRSAGDASTNWTNGAQARAALYKTRAMAAGAKWATDTAAAANNFQAAVTAGNIGQRFAAGVQRAGAAKYTAGIDAKGDRYSSGIAAGANAYTSGVGPYLAALNGFDAGPRGPRGDPRNYLLVNAVGNKLHETRMAMLAAGR